VKIHGKTITASMTTTAGSENIQYLREKSCGRWGAVEAGTAGAVISVMRQKFRQSETLERACEARS
jgi:hypothetical protein